MTVQEAIDNLIDMKQGHEKCRPNFERQGIMDLYNQTSETLDIAINCCKRCNAIDRINNIPNGVGEMGFDTKIGRSK